MPTSLSPVQIANVSLSKIGSATISSLTDLTSQEAITCNNNWELAYLEVSRSARWNCLLTTAVLTQIAQTPLPGCTPPVTPVAWAPLTSYAANVYLSYGGYIYITNYAYTSTNNFTNDLTTGALTQTNLPASSPFFPPESGGGYASGWAFQYALPSDFQLLGELNDQVYWDFWGWGCADYEIMNGVLAPPVSQQAGPASLFTNASQAVIKYVQNVADTTKFDSLFTAALTFKLASMIATSLRQDGGRTEEAMLAMYKQAMSKAEIKNAGERKPRRFDLAASSRVNRARFNGFNG